MTKQIIKTDNYILITSDEEIKIEDTTINLKSTHNHKELCTIDNDIELERYAKKQGNDCKKVIAHLPLNNSSILEGVPLLPPLPDEEDNLYNDAQEYAIKSTSSNKEARRKGYVDGFSKAKEKYKFTEDDVIKAIKMTRGSDIPIETIIQSISQPKLPVGFKCEIEIKPHQNYCYTMKAETKIINGVMQGEWIFE